MAIADQALRFAREFAGNFRRMPTPTGLLILPAIVCAIGLASCAQNTAQPGIEANHAPVPIHSRAQIATRAHHYNQKRPRRLDLALLAPQPAPDCKFDEPVSKTVDPDQWMRLKLDYERQCYQHAEKVVRERLVSLQQAVGGTRR